MGDIGRPKREIVVVPESEPIQIPAMPESEPVKEPSPLVPQEEPVGV